MKYIALLIFFTLISGCTNPTSNAEYAKENGEKLLISSGSYGALIERYQLELQENPTPKLRLKLAKAHYLVGDVEAAMFHLTLIPQKKLDTAELALLRANVFFDLGKIRSAEQYINIALRKDDRFGEAYNLQGLIFASKGQLTQAKSAFETARKHHYDDASIKNNLAMIALLQGNYTTAINILMPLVQSGRADDTTRANLLLAFAKAGRTRAFSQMLSEGNDDVYLVERFNSLNSALLTQTQSTPIVTRTSSERITSKSETLNSTSLPAVTTVKPATAPNSIITKQDIAKKAISHETETTDPLKRIKEQVKAAKEKKKQEALVQASIEKKKAAVAEEKKRLSKIKPSKKLVTKLEFKSSKDGAEYIATSDFDLGNIHTQFLRKRGKWVFDIEGAKDFTTKRKRYYKEGPAKAAELGEHKNFVRIVLTMRNKSEGKPTVWVKDNKLHILWSES